MPDNLALNPEKKIYKEAKKQLLTRNRRQTQGIWAYWAMSFGIIFSNIIFSIIINHIIINIIIKSRVMRFTPIGF